MSERRLTGIPAAEGVAVGPVHLLDSPLVVEQREIAPEDAAGELMRLDLALDTTEAHFIAQAEELEAAGRQAALEIVTAYRLMLRSPEIAGEARRQVVELAHGAEWAVRQATDQTRATFDAMEDPYLRERGPGCPGGGRAAAAGAAGIARRARGPGKGRPGASPSPSTFPRWRWPGCTPTGPLAWSPRRAVAARTPPSWPGPSAFRSWPGW